MSKIVELNEREIAEVTGGGFAAVWAWMKTWGYHEEQISPGVKG